MKNKLGKVTSKTIKLQNDIDTPAERNFNNSKKYEVLQSHSIIESNTAVHFKDSPSEKNSDAPIQEELLCCSNCAVLLDNYVSMYFCGEKVNPTCVRCLGDYRDDPFISFLNGMPTSLVAHWVPSFEECKTEKRSLSSITSMKSHYVRLPDPGGTFSAMEDVMQEFRILLNKQQQQFSDNCKQS